MDIQKRLQVGTVLSRTFAFYFKLFGVLFVAALMVLVPLNFLLSAIALQSDLWLSLLGLVVTLFATALVQAFAVNAVGDFQDGKMDPTRGEMGLAVGGLSM